LSEYCLNGDEDGYEEEEGSAKYRKEAIGTGVFPVSAQQRLDCLDIEYEFNTCRTSFSD
jgi:hypothetical protein